MITIDEEIFCNSPLQGTIFNVDIKTVLTLLNESCNDTNGETCIKVIRCVSETMQALQHHYYGYFESDKQIRDVKQNNENNLYNLGPLFYFGNFCMVITENYEILEQNVVLDY